MTGTPRPSAARTAEYGELIEERRPAPTRTWICTVCGLKIKGENAVLVGCRRADVIAGPVGIVVADSLLGEITPEMAQAIGQSDAKRVLIPVNHCDNIVVGVGDIPMARLVQAAVKEIGKLS